LKSITEASVKGGVVLHQRAGRVSVAVGVLVLASAVLAPQGRAAVDPGFGKSQAQMLMLDPRSAQLSFGVRFGATVADHRNLVARAQAQSTDYGIIGSALTAQGCTGGDPIVRSQDLPQQMQADSRDGDAGEVRTATEGPITQSVQALTRPFSKATSRLAEVDLPGILTIRGATSTTTAGVLKDGTPSVQADVRVGELSILGLAELQGLHWHALHQAGKDPIGTFTIGDATVGGMPVPTQDASAVVDAVNSVTSALGIVVTPPKSHVEGDTIFVDPIKVGVAPNPTRDLIAGTTVEALQPVREALFQAILDASCDSGALITVLDILLGSVTGGGSFTAVVGGAQAQRSAAAAGVTLGERGGSSGVVLGGSDGGAGAGPGFGAIGSDGSPVLGGPTGPTGGSGAAAGAGSGTAARPASATTGTDDDRGPAVAVGLGALLLGGVLVEADRRKMRQAGALAPATTEATA
jgi:hypothetical protein